MADKVVVVRLRAAVGEYTSGLAAAGGATVSFAGAVASAANQNDAAIAKAKTTLASLGQHAAAAGALVVAGIGGAMVVSAKAAIDFESSLAGVAKTVEGTPQQIEAIGEQMRRLATSIPVGVNELNRIAELGGQLGISVPNLKEFTEVIAALGVTTNLSTEEAATGLARLANVTGESQEDFDNLGSTIVDLGNNFATTESEILTFALRIAPSAQTVGVVASEVLGLSAALSSMGIPAERGGTAIQQMFTKISSAAKSGGDELRAMAVITGMTVGEFRELAEASPTDALVALATGLGEANAAGQDVFSMMRSIGINGVRAQAVLLAMANNTDLLTGALDRANTAYDENTALFEEAARRYGTTASQIRLMSNQFTDLRIEIGQKLIPGIRDVIDLLRELFRMMSEHTGVVSALGVALKVIVSVALVAGMIKLVGVVQSLGSSLAAAGRAIKTLVTGTQTLGSAAGGWATVIGVVLAGAVALLGKSMLDAAQRGAEAQRIAEQFTDSLEQGVPTIEAFRDSLGLEGSDLTSFVQSLDIAGLSLQTLLDIALQGPGALQATSDALLEQANALQKQHDAAVEAGNYDLALALEGQVNDMLDAKDRLEVISEGMDRFWTTRMTDMALAAQAVGVNTKFTFDQLMGAAQRFLTNNPLATDNDFVRFITGDMPMDGWMGQIQAIKAADEAARLAAMSWSDYLAVTDPDKMVNFFEDVSDYALQWAEDVTDAFDEVRDAILEGFPAWDEYEQMTIDSLDAVFKAQELFIQDMQGWAGLQSEIMKTASAATLDWLDALDPMTKGALARYWKDNLEQMGSDIAGFNVNLWTAAEAAEEVVSNRIPGIISASAASIPAKMQSLVGALELPEDMDPMGAYEDGINAFITTVEQTLGPNVVDAVLTELDASKFSDLYQQGWDAADKWGQGFESRLKSYNFEAAVTVATRRIEVYTNKGLEISSPSKVAMRIGEKYMDGFFLGMNNKISDFNIPNQRLVPSLQSIMAPVAGGGSSVTNEGSRTVQVYVDPVEKDTADQVALGLMLGGVTDRIEWAGPIQRL